MQSCSFWHASVHFCAFMHNDPIKYAADRKHDLHKITHSQVGVSLRFGKPEKPSWLMNQGSGKMWHFLHATQHTETHILKYTHTRTPIHTHRAEGRINRLERSTSHVSLGSFKGPSLGGNLSVTTPTS